MDAQFLKVRIEDTKKDAGTRLWQSFTAQSRQEFYKDITQGLGPGTQVSLTLNTKGKLCTIDMRYESKDGESCFHFIRNFSHRTDGIVASHVLASVSSSMQGKNTARMVQRNLLRLYEKIGVRKINIQTAFAGVYVWARMGFVPDLSEWTSLKRHIGDRLTFLEQYPPRDEGALPSAVVGLLRKTLEDTDPKNLWLVVDMEKKCHGMPLGKLLTMPWEKKYLSEGFPLQEALRYGVQQGLFWDGALDLKDADCLSRAKAYLGTEEEKKPQLRPYSARGPSHGRR